MKTMMTIEKRKVKGQTVYTLTRVRLYCENARDAFLGRVKKINFPTLELAVAELRWYENFDAGIIFEDIMRDSESA